MYYQSASTGRGDRRFSSLLDAATAKFMVSTMWATLSCLLNMTAPFAQLMSSILNILSLDLGMARL